MFGNIVADFQDLSTDETARYQSLYCGLCRSIKDRYGQLPRACLSFDLTFFVMALGSLYEPDEETGSSACIMHPIEKKPYTRSGYSDYAADLTVLLAYHKALDDWHDDGKLAARSFAHLLKKAYGKACERRPEQASAVERALAEIQILERQGDDSLDAAANRFGWLMGELLAYHDDCWNGALRRFGTELGRFIYAMDAAIDYEDDKETGSYNPFVMRGTDRAAMQMMLMTLIGKAADAFEKLPLVQDIRILRNILYAGVWQQYNKADNESAEHGGALPAQFGAAAM